MVERRGYPPSTPTDTGRPVSYGYFDDDTPPEGTRIPDFSEEPNRAPVNQLDTVEETYANRVNLPRLRSRIDAQNLPARTEFSHIKNAIEHSLGRRGNLILAGETGSGKSLYGPLAAREIVRAEGAPDRVVVLEPRRDAASRIGTAMAAVAGERVVGETIGFSTAEARQVRLDTNIKVVTQGIFLRWLKNGDLTKDKVGALVIDEVHEGSIEYHLILGLIKLMQDRDEAPPVMFMSATPNTARLQEFFGMTGEDCFTLEGRPHPVENFFAEKTTGDYVQDTADTVRTICSTKPEGDVLVFLPGAGEIKNVIQKIGQLPNTEVLPLHGQLPPEARDAALADSKPGVRRVIVATNIAETSLTIPGVRYVVDSGRERDVRYDREAGITRKGTGFISKAQSRQRAGRAGRTAPGEYHCLLSTPEFEALRELPEADIHRQNLSHLVLQLKHLGIEPIDFPFIDPPPTGAVEKAVEELQKLGALDEQGQLTPIGEKIGELKYFEPRIGRMLIEGRRQNCLEATLVLAAFERETKVFLPLSPAAEDRRLAEWADQGNSDWNIRLRIFRAAFENGLVAAATKSNRREEDWFYRWCRDQGFNAQALIHIAIRLDDYATAAGVETDPPEDFMEKIRVTGTGRVTRAIVAGHPDAVLLKFADFGYAPISAAATIANKTADRPNPIVISSRSAAFPNPPMMCIAKVSEAGRDKRLFAEAVHPIQLIDLIHVTPELLEIVTDDVKYNRHNQMVTSINRYYPRGLKNRRDYLLDEREEEVQNPREMTLAFARALATDEIGNEYNEGEAYPLKKINETNLDTLRYAKRLAALSRGRIQLPNNPEEWLAAWYAKKLDKAHTVIDAHEIKDRLELELEDLAPPDVIREMLDAYPSDVTIKGHYCSITYEPGSPIQAYLELHDADTLADLHQEDIPVFGPPDARVQPILRFDTHAGFVVEGASIIELQKKADEQRLSRLFYDSDLSHKRTKLHIDDTQTELPTPAMLGYEPVVFAKNFRGEPVYAYPGITYDVRTDTNVIYYFLTLEKAAENTAAAQRVRPHVLADRAATRAAKLERERVFEEQSRVRVESERLRMAYETWLRDHQPVSVDTRVDRSQPLPTPTDLGYEPIIYGNNSAGEPQYAYPCIVKNPGHFGQRQPTDPPYMLEYRPTEAAAAADQGKSFLQHEQRRAALERKAELRVVIDGILKEIEVVERSPDNPFTPDEIYRLRKTLRLGVSEDGLWWGGAVHSVADAEKLRREINDKLLLYRTEYVPLRARVEHLRTVLIRSGKTILLNPDKKNLAMIPGHPTPQEYDQICGDWRYGNSHLAENDIQKRKFTGLSAAIAALGQAEVWFTNLIERFQLVVPPLKTVEAVSSEPMSEAEYQEQLGELCFITALLEDTPQTTLVKEVRASLATLIADIKKNKNISFYQAAVGKIRHRAKEALRPAGYSREQIEAIHATYKKILTERVPMVEREYGGRLTPEGLRLIQPDLIAYAKKLTRITNEADQHTLEEEINATIAEALTA